MLDAFKTDGASPPARRYRLKLATWTVVREPGQPSPRKLDCPTAVAKLARDFLRTADDDKEHFWVVLLNAQNRYLLHTEVSMGTQSSSLVHHVRCSGLRCVRVRRRSFSFTTIRAATRRRARRTYGSHGNSRKPRSSSTSGFTITSSSATAPRRGCRWPSWGWCNTR